MTERSNQRGQGRLAGALARKSRVAQAPEANTPASADDPQSAPPKRQRGATRAASRSGSARKGGAAEYKQCLAYIRREVRDRVEQARTDPEVRSNLETNLRDRGVPFKQANPEYSALVELLLIDWLNSVGYPPK